MSITSTICQQDLGTLDAWHTTLTEHKGQEQVYMQQLQCNRTHTSISVPTIISLRIKTASTPVRASVAC